MPYLKIVNGLLAGGGVFNLRATWNKQPTGFPRLKLPREEERLSTSHPATL